MASRRTAAFQFGLMYQPLVPVKAPCFPKGQAQSRAAHKGIRVAWSLPLLPQWPLGLGWLRRVGHPFPIVLGCNKGDSLDTLQDGTRHLWPMVLKGGGNERVQAGGRGTY